MSQKPSLELSFVLEFRLCQLRAGHGREHRLLSRCACACGHTAIVVRGRRAGRPHRRHMLRGVFGARRAGVVSSGWRSAGGPRPQVALSLVRNKPPAEVEVSEDGVVVAARAAASEQRATGKLKSKATLDS